MDYYVHVNDALGGFAICDSEGKICKEIPKEADARINVYHKDEHTLGKHAYYKDVTLLGVEKNKSGEDMLFFQHEGKTYCLWQNEQSTFMEGTTPSNVTKFVSACKRNATEVMDRKRSSVSSPSNMSVKDKEAIVFAKGDAMIVAQNTWNSSILSYNEYKKTPEYAERLASIDVSSKTGSVNGNKHSLAKAIRQKYFGSIKPDSIYAKVALENLKSGKTEFNTQAIRSEVKASIKANIPITDFSSLSKQNLARAKSPTREPLDIHMLQEFVYTKLDIKDISAKGKTGLTPLNTAENQSLPSIPSSSRKKGMGGK